MTATRGVPYLHPLLEQLRDLEDYELASRPRTIQKGVAVGMTTTLAEPAVMLSLPAEVVPGEHYFLCLAGLSGIPVEVLEGPHAQLSELAQRVFELQRVEPFDLCLPKHITAWEGNSRGGRRRGQRKGSNPWE